MTCVVVKFSSLDRWDPPQDSPRALLSCPILTLGQVAELRLGVQIPRQGSVIQGATVRPYLRAANVQRGYLDRENVKTMQVLPAAAERLELKRNDLLFVEGNSFEEVGRCAMWGEGETGTIVQNSVVRARLVDANVDPNFVMVWFNSNAGGSYVRENATTTSGSLWHIGAGKLANAPVPVPGLDVQRRAVSMYQHTLTRAQESDVRSETLEKAAWLEFGSQVAGSHEVTTATEATAVMMFSSLDRWDSWAAPAAVTSNYPVLELAQVAEVQLGTQLQRSAVEGERVPYLRVANVQRGHIDLSDVYTMNVSSATVDRLALEPDDLLFLEANALDEVGRCARWAGELPLCIHQNHVIRARLNNSDLLPRFVEAWFNSPPGASHVRARARTTSGTLYTIPVNVLASAPVPVPPLDVQALLLEELSAGIMAARQAKADSASLREQAEVDLVTALSSV